MPSTVRSAGLSAPISIPRRRAIEALPCPAASRSPSISLLLSTSAVRVCRTASWRRLNPRASMWPISRPCRWRTAAKGSARRSRLHSNRGQPCSSWVYILRISCGDYTLQSPHDANIHRRLAEKRSGNLRRVVSVARLHHHALFLRGQVDLVVGYGLDVAVRGVAQAVHAPQLLFDRFEHLRNGALLRDAQEPAAGLVRNLVQRAPAVAVESAEPPEPSAVGVRVLEQHRIDQRVGPFGRLPAFLQRAHAGRIHAVGENHQGLAAGLLLHDLVGCEEHGIVKGGASSAHASASSSASASAAATAAAGELAAPAAIPLLILRELEQPERLFELGARGSEVLQQLYLALEMDHKRAVQVFAQYLVEELEAGRAFLGYQVPLASAHIHQKPQRERQIALLREVFDGLRAAVFLELEIVLGEVSHHLALLVPDRREQVDYLDAGRKRRVLAAQQAQGREERKRGEQAAPGHTHITAHSGMRDASEPRLVTGGAGGDLSAVV